MMTQVIFLNVVTAQQKIIYTCPMHPEVQMEKPGKCPKCGMALVKKTIKSAAPKPVTPKADKPTPKEATTEKKAAPQKVDMPQLEKLKEATATTKIIYTCVMHPEIKRDKPGNCPKCGMKLVKKTIKVPASTMPIPGVKQPVLEEPKDTMNMDHVQHADSVKEFMV